MNRSLGNLLRCLDGNKPSNWEMVLAQVEFAYNNSVNRSTGKTPFEIITRMKPRGVSNLRDVAGEEKRSVTREEFSDFMRSLYKEVKLKLEKVVRSIRRMLISLSDIMFLKLVMR